MDTSKLKAQFAPFASGGSGASGVGVDSRDGGGGGGSGNMKYVIAAVIVGSLIGNMFIGRRFRSFKHVKSPMNKHSQDPGQPWEIPSPRNNYRNDHINERNYRANQAYKTPFPPASGNGGGGASDINGSGISEIHAVELSFYREYVQWLQQGASEGEGKATNSRPRFTFPNSSTARRPHTQASSGTEWASYLITLNLPHELVPLSAEVKAAYRSKVRAYVCMGFCLALSLALSLTPFTHTHTHTHTHIE
jgi:hypothetical protein